MKWIDRGDKNFLLSVVSCSNLEDLTELEVKNMPLNLKGILEVCAYKSPVLMS